jgi:tripartite-type tricarboxylate transporter receptor subunit TctC
LSRLRAFPKAQCERHGYEGFEGDDIMPTFKTLASVIAGLVALGLSVSSAAAQDYPTRNITLIVPFAAGGPTDVVSRIIGDHTSRTLGQTIVIENTLGAGGTTASTRAKDAAPIR